MMHLRSAAAVAVVALFALLTPSVVAPAYGQFVFAEGTSPAEMARYNAAWAAENGPIDRYVTTTRWPGTLGEGAAVTFSYVPDGVLIPAPAGVSGGDVPSSLFGTLDGQFQNLGGRTRWQGAIGLPLGTATPVTTITAGGASVWQNVTNLRLLFQRRSLGSDSSDSPAVNFWDDGAAWTSPGPLHPVAGPVEGLTLTFTANPPTLVSAVVTINGAGTVLSIVRTPAASPIQFDLTSPANDTIGELVTAINANAGFAASVGAGVAGSTPSVVLAGSQTLNLSAGTPVGALETRPGVAPEHGDIRIGMRPLPSSILASVTPPGSSGGEIMLNSTLTWTLGTNSRVLQNTIARAFGEALGLAQVCPNDKTKLMEPILNLNVTTPQIDDIRGIQRLYGDVLNIPAAGFGVTDPTRTIVFEPNDDPTVNPSVVGGPWPLGGVNLLGDQTNEIGLSLDDVTDADFFALQIGNQGSSISVDVRITVTPVGGTYSVGAVDSACSGTPINASAVYNPRANIFTKAPAGLPVGDGSAPSGAPFTSFIDTAGAGQPEVVTARISVGDLFIIGVSATGTPSNQSLLYNLKLEFINRNLVTGVAVGPIAADSQWVLGQQATSPDDPQPRLDGFSGHGALTFRTDNLGNPHFYNTNYVGQRALYATVEGEDPTPNHVAFAGRPIGVIKWGGVNPAVDQIGDHPTQVTGAAAGATIPTGSTFFRGIAPEAGLYSSNIASAIDPTFGFFTVSNEAVYYALFALSDPLIAPTLGLPRPITVMNSSYGGLGDFRGDSATAHAYDAAVSTFGTTIVVAAGNDGEIDNTSACGDGSDDNTIPGGDFVGSRTVGSPGTAFNVLTVGAVGKGIYTEEFPPPTMDGGGGGGGGGGGALFGLPGGGEQDPTSIALNTVVNFSSKGPVDTFNYTPNAFTVQSNARPGVHIVAAGTGTIARAIDPALFENAPDPCAQYGDGHSTLKGIGLPIPDSTLDNRFEETQGTSFAAPIVAGAVAMLQDFGLAQVPPQNIDSLVMRSVLMTSAVKLPGWSNNGNPAKPQDDRDGRNWTEPTDIISTQLTGAARPLDLAQGAGLLSIPYAFSIYAMGDLRDSPLTDPNKPSQTPAGETLPPQFGERDTSGRPATRSLPGIWSDEETTDLRRLLPQTPPLSGAEAERIFKGWRDLNQGIVYKPSRRPDTTDPDLTPGGGGKSGAGLFDGRDPFLPGGSTPGAFTGDGPPPTKPILIPTSISGGRIGWDIGNLGIKPLRLASGSRVGGVVDYVLNIPFSRFPDLGPQNPPYPPSPDQVDGPTFITATLVWNRTVSVKKPNFALLDNPQVGQLTELELEDLNLELFQTATGDVFDGQEPVAFSRTTFSNIEHIHFRVPTAGVYVLRVTWAQRHYNFFRNLPRGGVKYALSWAWRPELDTRVGWPNRLPAPPAVAPMAGLPLLNEVLFRFGAEIGQGSYSGLADINQDGVVNTADLVWVLSRLNNRPGTQYEQD